jgi:hypothetical protein
LYIPVYAKDPEWLNQQVEKNQQYQVGNKFPFQIPVFNKIVQ